MRSREYLRFVAGAVLILVLLFGQRVYGALTSESRIDPALRGAVNPVDVVAVLDFTPERFHQERLAAYGVFSGRDRAANRIRLKQVTPNQLAALAQVPWVAHIEPLR